MQWTDDGIVLGIKRHGEANAILELMTREHGRHLGLVRGGAGPCACVPSCSPGTLVHARLVCTARRASRHLRGRRAEPAGGIVPLGASHAVYAVTHVAGLARLLPERDPHETVLFDTLDAMLDHFDDPAPLCGRVGGPLRIAVVQPSWFSGSISKPAPPPEATSDLAYVSPKSGRAVSREGGEAWRDKLLRLPDFLRHRGA